jgi:glycerol kinase
MSSTTKRAHFVRAVLEGVAFQTCEVLEALTEDSDLRLKSLKVGGGMAVNDLFLQIQANLLDIEVSTLRRPCFTAPSVVLADPCSLARAQLADRPWRQRRWARP